MKVETRKVVHPDQPGQSMVINAADFDPAKHEPWSESSASSAVPEETGTGHRVEKSGTWYKLIGPDGEQVGKAQRSEAEAWTQADSAD